MFGVKDSAQATEMAKDAAKKLAEAAQAVQDNPFGREGMDLAEYANEVAKWTGAARAFGEYERACQYIDANPDKVTEPQMVKISTLMDLLGRGADDCWSGRGNDYKRAYFDGVREVVNDLKWNILNRDEV